jgi:hypothetical protein
MSYRLLIDECLSPKLVVLAQAAGHHESTCVRDRGWQGLQDHELMRHVLAQDFTLVTHNAYDFRGPGGGPLGGLHNRAEIHAGLICLDSALPIDILRQQRLFQRALIELEKIPDLINQALEIYEQEDGSLIVTLYRIPAGEDGPDN